MALCAACILTSCIDGREEIWLAADGSGRADVSYSLPASVAKFQGGEAGIRKLIGDFLAKTPEIQSSSHEVTTEGDRLKIHVRATFDSALDLKEISTGSSLGELPSSAAHLAGKVELKISGRTVDLSRTVSAGQALPGARFMPASSLDGHRMTYIMHLPMAALESNATQTENEGRTLIWDYSLADAVKAPVTTRFKAQIPIPGWFFGAVGGGAAVLAALVVFLARKRRFPHA